MLTHRMFVIFISGGKHVFLNGFVVGFSSLVSVYARPSAYVSFKNNRIHHGHLLKRKYIIQKSNEKKKLFNFTYLYRAIDFFIYTKLSGRAIIV